MSTLHSPTQASLQPEPQPDPQDSRMTRTEVRASASLASIFALRMLGLFLILPVFSVHARSMPGATAPP